MDKAKVLWLAAALTLGGCGAPSLPAVDPASPAGSSAASVVPSLPPGLPSSAALVAAAGAQGVARGGNVSMGAKSSADASTVPVALPVAASPPPAAALGNVTTASSPDPLAALEGLLAIGPLHLMDLSELNQLVQPGGYATQMYPSTSQPEAEAIAEKWAPDAKQMYVAAGFFITPHLGMTRHVFYSPSKDERLLVYFYGLTAFTKQVVEKARPGYALANPYLDAAQDVYAYKLDDCLDRARAQGYRPKGWMTVAAMIHPLVLGPMWVFLDDATDQKPQIAINAQSGDVITPNSFGWSVIKQLVTY